MSRMMSGAAVIVSPLFGSPCLTCQTTWPVSASSATVVASSWLKTILPSPYATPRLTTSQHATPWTVGSWLGLYIHLIGAPGFVRSSAYTMFGNEVTKYIVLLTTSRAPSSPFSVPVENVQATFRSLTFWVLSWSSSQKRVPAYVLPGSTHWLGSIWSCTRSCALAGPPASDSPAATSPPEMQR